MSKRIMIIPRLILKDLINNNNKLKVIDPIIKIIR